MRLIDSDALKAKWYEINDIDENDRGARFVGYTEIARLIDQAPTIDAVEVVRCGECEHMTADGRCMEFADDGIRPSAADYCSYGRREDGEA